MGGWGRGVQPIWSSAFWGVDCRWRGRQRKRMRALYLKHDSVSFSFPFAIFGLVNPRLISQRNVLPTHFPSSRGGSSIDLVTDTFTGTYAFVIIGPITFKCLCYGDFCSWILNYYVNLVCIEWKHSSYMRVFFLCNRMTAGTLSLELPIKRQIQQQHKM